MTTSENFVGGYMTYEEGHSNLAERIYDGWRNMRDATSRLLAEDPSESRLLFYVLMSDMIFFLSWSIKTIIAPMSGAAERMPLEIGGWLIFALLCRTSAMYVFSMVVGSFCRVCGGSGDWKDTRAAVFFGALVAAPFGFLFALITVMLYALEPTFPVLGADWIALWPYSLSLVPFVWFISAGVATAHGFKNTSTVFAAMSCVAVAGVLFAMYLKAQGAF